MTTNTTSKKQKTMTAPSKKIMELLEHANLSLKQFSRQTGIPYRTIINWKHGGRAPTRKNLETVAKFFSIDMEYLVQDEDTRSPSQVVNADAIKPIKKPLDELFDELRDALKSCSSQEQNLMLDILNELCHIAAQQESSRKPCVELLFAVFHTVTRYEDVCVRSPRDPNPQHKIKEAQAFALCQVKEYLANAWESMQINASPGEAADES